MKKFAKILSAVLCLAMVLSFASIAIAAENNTVSTVIADYADANGWSNSTLYATVNLDSVVSVTTSGTAVNEYGQNTGKYYESDESWRIYQAETPSIVVSAGEQNIVSVKVTYVSNKDGVLTLNGTNVASDEVVSVNAPSVTFGVANTGDATNGQVRITAIEVVYDGKAGTAPTPTPTEPTPTEPTVPVATFKAEIVSALAAGDKVYVYYPNGDEAMSATANGKKLAGVAATKEGDFLMITEGAAELTVAIDANGYYTFTCNGLYLTSGETGNQLYFAEAASDYSLWELTVEGDGYLIRNVNAAYYGNANQYLEYYNGFTTYGLKETSDRAAYTFAFAKAVADEEPPVTEPTEPETQPTEPETQPTEPETQPTEPETQPTEPEAQPSEPETQATTAPAATETIKPTTPVNPGTGDNSPVMLAVGMMMAAACLIVLVQKKRAV